jgi:hypothetical protein
MATRKIKITMSSNLLDGTGSIVDIDFNSVNLDVDYEVVAANGVSTVEKEYTVDVDAGTYDLDITFKNDAITTDEAGETTADRNLVIESIKVANDGADYDSFIVSASNCTPEDAAIYAPMGYMPIQNPSYNADQAVSMSSNWPYLLDPSRDDSVAYTDDRDIGYVKFTHPGNNARNQYTLVINPATVYKNSTATFNITFT